MSCNFCKHIKKQGMIQYCSKRNNKEIICDQSNTCDYYEPLENAPSWVNRPKPVHHSASDITHEQNMNTPRTDEEIFEHPSGYEVVISELAYQLERELTAARAEIEELNEEYGTWWAQKSIALDELKEVTEQRDRLAEALESIVGESAYEGLPELKQLAIEEALQSLTPKDHE